MIAKQTAIHIYSLLNGKIPDLFTALLCQIYTFANSSHSPCSLHSSLPLFPIDYQYGSNPVHSSVPGPMSSHLNQYVFHVMRRSNLPGQSIIDISPILHVYIIHIRGHHISELSWAVPDLARKGRVQEAVKIRVIISLSVEILFFFKKKMSLSKF